MVCRVLTAGAVAVALFALPVSVRAETLTEALASAYTNNPEIASALLSVKSSAEDVALGKAGKRPNISFSGSITDEFSIGEPRANAPSGATNEASVTAGISFNQRLFDNFRTEAQIEQARAAHEVAEQALRNAEQNVLLSVVEAYMGVIRDTQLIQLRADNVTFLQRQVQSAEDRLEIGEGTRVDVSQAQTRLAQGVAAYRAAIASLQTSQASYARWVGHPPQNLTQDFRFGNMLPGSVEEATATAEAIHPAILSARAAIRVAQAGSDAASSAFGPTLDLVGQVCAIGCFGGDPNIAGISGSVSVQLSVPIYSGGSLGARVRKANIEQIRSEVDAMATRDQVREAVVSSWATLQNATAQIESAQSALESAQLVLESTIQSRDVGQSTTLDVLDAQATVTSTREQLISATATRIIASFALVASSGQLSAETLGLPVEIKSAEGYTAKVEDVWKELRALD